MRPRKNLLPLTPESLAALMIPGRPYTAARLSCIFDGSPAAICALLMTLEATGRVQSSLADKGRRPDRREARRIFWIPLYVRTDVAARRQAPAEMQGELRYDLTSFARLALASRR